MKQNRTKYSDSSYLGLGTRIKQLRKSLKYNYMEMAAHMGVSEGAYKKYENNERYPSPPAQLKLFEKLGVSMDWLLFNNGPMYLKDKKMGREWEQQITGLKEKLQQAERQKEELAAYYGSPPELAEVIEWLKKDSVLFHEVMAHFQRYKRQVELPGDK